MYSGELKDISPTQTFVRGGPASYQLYVLGHVAYSSWSSVSFI